MNSWSTNDNQLPSSPYSGGLATPLTIADEDFPVLNDWGIGSSPSTTFVGSPTADLLSSNPLQLYDENSSDRLNRLAKLPPSDSAKDATQRIEKSSNNSSAATNTTNEDELVDSSSSQADCQAEKISDGIEGRDEAQQELFGNPSSGFNSDSSTLSNNSSIEANSHPTESNSNTPNVVTSSDKRNPESFFAGTSYYETGESLILTVLPSPNQHAWHENALKKTPPYITTLNKDAITIKMPDVRSQFRPEISFWMRITRTTIPYGEDRLVFRHPYPIWIDNKLATVHNGSLFVPITGELIKLDNLMMERLKQGSLRSINQWANYKPTELNFNDFHSINAEKAKRKIEEYQLRYSVFHFDMFVVDENTMTYPTDLHCQTDPIYEYDPKEIKELPTSTANVQTNSLKRKSSEQQEESKSTKMAKTNSQD